MNFSTKKRPRKNAWKELQKELDNREQLEEENAAKFARLDVLKARTAQGEPPHRRVRPVHPPKRRSAHPSPPSCAAVPGVAEEELDPEKTHVYMDLRIGREEGKDPMVTRGRLIIELFDDIMPRTVEQFIKMLENRVEPTYRGSNVTTILPGDYAIAGDRTSFQEGAASLGSQVVFSRVEQEANWQVPHLNPGVLSLADAKTSKFNITFRNSEELDGWHAVFGKTVYGFDVLKAISEQGNDNGEPRLPVVIVGGGSVPRGTHPREVLKAMVQPKEKGDERKVMRYSSTYRHTGLIGH